MKNKKLLILIPALAMMLAACGETSDPEPKPGPDPIGETVHVESVSLNKTTLALDLDGEEALTATVLPANATDGSVTWSSSNTSVATVTERGKVVGVAVGTATITATTNDGSKTATCEVTVTMPRWGDENHPINVTTALAQAASDLTVGMAVTPVPMYVEGYVIAATNGSYVKNVYIADSATETDKTKQLLVYSADYNPNKNINAIYEGDKVMFVGYMQQYYYNGDENTPLSDCTLEMTAYNKVNVAIAKAERGTSPIRLSAHANSTVTNLPESGKNDSTFKFNVTPASGFAIVEVAANGVACTKDSDGKYVGKVQGPTVITVETATAGLEVKKATLAYTNSTVTGNMVAGNNAESVGLDGSIFEVTADKGEASNLPGLNKAGEIRLYNYNSKDGVDNSKLGKNNTITVKGVGVTISQIVVNCTQYPESLQIKAGDTVVTGVDSIYAINGKSFTLANIHTVNESHQVYIKSIKISYTVDPRIACTGITVSKDSVSLLPHMKAVVTATTAPADCTDPVVWTSSDATVATVSSGNIEALKAGTATITAKAGDITKTIAVTVNPFVAPENKTGETINTKNEIVNEDGSGKTVTNCVVAGYITEITSGTYGNGWMYTTDDVKVQLYGLYDLNGKDNGFRYDKMTVKPEVGDFVILKGKMKDYSGPELENGAVLQINDTKCVPTPATGMAFSKESAEVNAGETLDLKKLVTMTPSDGVANITFTSSDTSKATISGNVLTGVAPGTITVTGRAEGLTDITLQVVVKEVPKTPLAAGTYTFDFQISLTGLTEGADITNKIAAAAAVEGFTIVVSKGGVTSVPALYTDGGIRLYGDKAKGNGGKLTISVAEGFKISKVVVGIGASSNNGGVLVLNDVAFDEISATNRSLERTLETPASSIVLQNDSKGGSSNVQVRIATVAITVVAA